MSINYGVSFSWGWYLFITSGQNLCLRCSLLPNHNSILWFQDSSGFFALCGTAILVVRQSPHTLGTWEAMFMNHVKLLDEPAWRVVTTGRLDSRGCAVQILSTDTPWTAGEWIGSRCFCNVLISALVFLVVWNSCGLLLLSFWYWYCSLKVVCCSCFRYWYMASVLVLDFVLFTVTLQEALQSKKLASFMHLAGAGELLQRSQTIHEHVVGSFGTSDHLCHV